MTGVKQLYPKVIFILQHHFYLHHGLQILLVHRPLLALPWPRLDPEGKAKQYQQSFMPSFPEIRNDLILGKNTESSKKK